MKTISLNLQCRYTKRHGRMQFTRSVYMEGAIIRAHNIYVLATDQIGVYYLKASQKSCMTCLYLSFLVPLWETAYIVENL